MPVKYSCPKCGRRFAEWGAEKSGFKCPGDEWCPADRPDVIELVRVGMKDDAKPAKKPTLKRPVKRVVATPSSMNEDELLVPDIEEIEADTEIEDEDVDEVEDEEDDVIEVVAVAPIVDADADVEEDDLAEADVVVVEDADVDETLEDAEDIVEDEWK